MSGLSKILEAHLNNFSRVKTQVGTFNEEKVLLEAFFKYCDNYREISLPPPLHTTHCMLQILAITPATSQYTICCSAAVQATASHCMHAAQPAKLGELVIQSLLKLDNKFEIYKMTKVKFSVHLDIWLVRDGGGGDVTRGPRPRRVHPWPIPPQHGH